MNIGTGAPLTAEAIEPDQLLALLWRSEWSLAQMVARFRLGMNYDESKAYLATLTAPDKQERPPLFPAEDLR